VRISGSGMAKAGAERPTIRSRHMLRAITMVTTLCAGFSLVPACEAVAQGIATAAIRGTVRSDNGADLDGASVRIINSATGVATHAMVRGGRFFVQGIEVGGPYVVEVRRIGYEPQRSEPLHLALGEPIEIQFVMQSVAVRLDPVLLSATGHTASLAGGGATLIPSVLERGLLRRELDLQQQEPLIAGQRRRICQLIHHRIDQAGRDLITLLQRVVPLCTDGAELRLTARSGRDHHGASRDAPVRHVRLRQRRRSDAN
jgi:hypothetical protein